jgi:hypothetical protein
MADPVSEQTRLRSFIKRRHPEYDAMESHWAFLQDTYNGGREWFVNNIFKYHKEGDDEYSARRSRAYRFNHTREVVDLVDKHIFKMLIVRREGDAPESVKKFWENSTLNGLEIEDYAKRISCASSTNGRVWVVVDSNRTGKIRTKADEKKAGVRVYSYMVLPQDALDMSYDDRGDLNWILIRETTRDDADPIDSSGKVKYRYRLWTRTFSQLFETKGEDSKDPTKVKVIPRAPIMHNLGVVPVFAADNVISDEPYTSPAMIADVAYLDRAVANYLSNMDAIIQDQTFSQLAMPAQGLMPGTDTDTATIDKLIQMGTKRVFTYNGEGNAAPFYLSPDVKQAELILAVVGKIINEIYHSVGLSGERTKDDSGKGIDNASGVAKAYDFERVNALLASKAGSLERIENRLCWLVAKWHGEEKMIEELENELVEYPDNFDVRSLYDEFEIAARLALIDAPDEVRQEQMNTLIEKLFPQVKEEVMEALKESVKSWPPDPVEMARKMAEAGAAGAAKGDPIKKEGKNAIANKVVNS